MVFNDRPANCIHQYRLGLLTVGSAYIIRLMRNIYYFTEKLAGMDINKIVKDMTEQRALGKPKHTHMVIYVNQSMIVSFLELAHFAGTKNPTFMGVFYKY